MRGVLLDRDGVINDVVLREGKPYPPPSVGSLAILPGVAATLRRLRDAGLRVIVVTNQPDVGTGRQRREVVDAMHRRLLGELAIDAIKTCFHTDDDACACRKPRPGMLLAAAREWELDLGASYMVGDRWRDVGAGRAAGCRTFWIDRGYRERAPDSPDHVVRSLEEAGRIILQEASP